MFQYFPTNYIWSVSVDIALESGGQVGEVDEICRPLRDASERGEDAGTPAFLAAWSAMASKLVALAGEDEAAGRLLSSGEKLKRASLYYMVAERMQSRHLPERREAYAKVQDCFRKGVAQARDNCERMEIPYQGGAIAGLFTRAEGVEGPAPCLVHINGLDSTKELLYFAKTPHALARRGVSSLVIDQPGTGEALRLHQLSATPESEQWASVVVDALERRPDVRPDRIGLMGVSLGGYYAPRAVAFEPRFALGAVWGGNHDWREVQKRRLAREGEKPVPHYWDHVQWVFGAKDMDSFMTIAERMTLDAVVEKMKVPSLVTHGENDRQIPLEYAEKTYAALVNSPRRDFKLFTAREGGVEHSSLDNLSNARDYMADWIAETFACL